MNIFYADYDNRQKPNFRWHLEHGSPVNLFVLFKSPASVFIDGDYVDVEPGTCVFFAKGAIRSYRSRGDGEFVHDFMEFDFESESERATYPFLAFGAPNARNG